MTDKAKAACLENALEHASTQDVVSMVHICQGKPRCDFDGTQTDHPMPCPFCLSIRADDPRDTDEILASMGRTQ